MSSISKKIILKSSDGKAFDVEQKVVMTSKTIKQMIEDDCASNEIYLPNISSNILAKVIEYCKKHIEVIDNTSSTSFVDTFEDWDIDFVNVDQNTLFNLIQAANFLNIRSLFDLTCKAMADIMKDMEAEDIRKVFNIKNDFIP